jgi:hypothetical protein
MKGSPIIKTSVQLATLPRDCRLAIIFIQARGCPGKLKQRIKGED